MQLELANTSLREALEHGIAMVSERADSPGHFARPHPRSRRRRRRGGPAAAQASDPANLLTNAVKFTPAGGTIEASAPARGDEIHVSVKDSGIGIAESDQARIFDAFQQGAADGLRVG